MFSLLQISPVYLYNAIWLIWNGLENLKLQIYFLELKIHYFICFENKTNDLCHCRIKSWLFVTMLHKNTQTKHQPYYTWNIFFSASNGVNFLRIVKKITMEIMKMSCTDVLANKSHCLRWFIDTWRLTIHTIYSDISALSDPWHC